jgi:hypothetical protein
LSNLPSAVTVTSALFNVLYFCCLASFVYGAWLMWKPAGWMVGGVVGVAALMLIDRERAKDLLDKMGRRTEEEE